MSGVANGRVEVLGCQIDCLTLAQTAERCEQLIEQRGYVQHVAINTAKLVAMRRDDQLRSIVANCGLVNADGQGVVWAARLLGAPLPERVAGIDLMGELIARAAAKRWRVYVLGAKRPLLEKAIERLRVEHPGLVIAGYRDGYFDDRETAAVCADIRDARADCLFVAMDTPRKEYFLGEHGPALGVPFVMGVGGAIDVIAGVRRRAPARWQRLGLEWLYRLLQEPRRLARRYLVTNATLLLLVSRALLGRAARRCARNPGAIRA
jgi:N-acetylglucosaminyldiphosphoundecaprenol N-acetyl-beta-D-mannosaminyltransferase